MTPNPIFACTLRLSEIGGKFEDPYFSRLVNGFYAGAALQLIRLQAALPGV